jgi:hypothetical protein
MWSSLQFLPGLFLQVTSPLGDVLHHADKVSHGQFAFTTAESGIYLACFWTETLEKGMVVNLNLDWRTGIAAKDWDSIAKKEKLDVSTIPVILRPSGPVCFSMWNVDCEKDKHLNKLASCRSSLLVRFSLRQFRIKQTGSRFPHQPEFHIP